MTAAAADDYYDDDGDLVPDLLHQFDASSRSKLPNLKSSQEAAEATTTATTTATAIPAIADHHHYSDHSTEISASADRFKDELFRQLQMERDKHRHIMMNQASRMENEAQQYLSQASQYAEQQEQEKSAMRARISQGGRNIKKERKKAMIRRRYILKGGFIDKYKWRILAGVSLLVALIVIASVLGLNNST